MAEVKVTNSHNLTTRSGFWIQAATLLADHTNLIHTQVVPKSMQQIKAMSSAAKNFGLFLQLLLLQVHQDEEVEVF